MGGRYDSRITVVRGSVVDLDVDAIVNAANTRMRGGGGIDGRIHQLAGFKLLDYLRRVAPQGASVGEVVCTPAFNLKQRFIFHVAGPIWSGGSAGEPELLALAYSNCIRCAKEQGIESIGFCSVSTGSFGFPVERAAPIALASVSQAMGDDALLQRVVFAMYGSEEFRAFGEALQAP